MKEIIIEENDSGQRLDKFLLKTFPSLPKGMLFKAVRNKKIKVNRKRTQADYKLKTGDSILLFLPPDALQEKETDRSFMQAGSLEVVYEDDDVLIVNKPAGVLSVPDESGFQDTMIERIWKYLASTSKWQPEDSHSFKPALISRLDRNTSGLMSAAKNSQALRVLSQAVKERKIHKSYIALAEGKLGFKEKDVQNFIKKDGLKAAVSHHEKEGFLPSRTVIKVLETRGNDTLIEAELKTGRFHQIRATLADLGHPLKGDVKYGSKAPQPYFLQACRIEFEQLPLACSEKVIELTSN